MIKNTRSTRFENRRRTLLTLSTVLIAITAWSQVDSTATGEVVDAQIVIEKDKQIVLPQAEKQFRKTPLRSFQADPLTLNYQVIEPDFNWPPYKSDVSFRPVQNAGTIPSFQHYIKAGYGNLSSPLFELGLARRFQQVKAGALFFFERFGKGPVGDNFSAASTARADLYATYLGESFSVTPKIAFAYDQFNFYGNTNRLNTGFSSEFPDKARINTIGLSVDMEGMKKNFGYQVTPSFSSVAQKLEDGTNINTESSIGIQGNLRFKIDTAFSSGFDLEGHSANYDGNTTYTRSLFKFSPWVSHSSKDLLIKGGFTIASGKTPGTGTTSGFYPFARVEWNALPDWTLFGFVDGDVQWNSLESLLNENFFLDDSLNLLNTEVSSAFGGGIKGSPIKNLNLEAGVKLENLENLPIYIPSSSDSSRFLLTYDQQTINRFTFYGDASFSPSASTLIGTHVAFYGYSVETLDRPWHLPTYRFTLYTSHKIKEKLLIDTEWTGMGGIKAPVISTTNFITLKSFLDVNLTTNYLLTERASVFFQVNNLLGSEYEKYIGYPVRGLTFKLGGKYRF